MRGQKKLSLSANEEVANVMPTVELIEYERVTYIKEMERYLQDLKSMPDAEARRKSRINLEDSGIIQENGEFTEKYSYGRRHIDSEG